MLVDLRGSVQPKQQLDVEPRIIEDDQLRLAKPRGRLKRLLIVAQKGAGESRKLHLRRRGFFLESRPRNTGEGREGKIHRLPSPPHPPSEIDKKRIHD